MRVRIHVPLQHLLLLRIVGGGNSIPRLEVAPGLHGQDNVVVQFFEVCTETTAARVRLEKICVVYLAEVLKEVKAEGDRWRHREFAAVHCIVLV